MAVYAIGDIQGCYDELQRLLEQLRFDPASDRLWFAGDLVNRGPASLEVLRFVRNLGEGAVTVLGNHDLHLLAIWRHRDHLRRGDTIAPILEAEDGGELLDWLRRRPLLHHDPNLDTLLVHAGLPPQWDIPTAITCAGEIEQALRGDALDDFIAHMYGNEPYRWNPGLTGWDRLRFAVNCFTRMRYCHADGSLDFQHKGPPGDQPADLLPWYEVPGRASADTRIIFGHWSALGLFGGHNVRALDTGCLWGGSLTALRLDHPDEPVTAVDCKGVRRPGTQKRC